MKKQPQKILCAIDFSESTDTILSYGIGMCKAYRAKLLLTHVVSDLHTLLHIHNQKTLDGGNLQQTKNPGIRLEKILVGCDFSPDSGFSFTYGLELAIKFQSTLYLAHLVLGIRGHTIWEKLTIGSTTDRVIRESPCPVLVVRHSVMEKAQDD